MKKFILGLSMTLLLNTWVYSQESEPLLPTEETIEQVTGNEAVAITEEITAEQTSEETMKWYSDHQDHSRNGDYSHRKSRIFDPFDNRSLQYVIPIVAIVFTFMFPAVIVFIIYYFRYKNRKQQYKLAEQALAAGQPIPPGLFKEDINQNLRSKGINNIFTGLGLFIFLWAATGKFGIGTIGLVVLFMGFGQVIVYYLTRKEEEERNSPNNFYANEDPSRTPWRNGSDNSSFTEE